MKRFCVNIKMVNVCHRLAGVKVLEVVLTCSTVVLSGSLVSMYSQPSSPDFRKISSSSVRVTLFLPLEAMTSPPASRDPHSPKVPGDYCAWCQGWSQSLTIGHYTVITGGQYTQIKPHVIHFSHGRGTEVRAKHHVWMVPQVILKTNDISMF